MDNSTRAITNTLIQYIRSALSIIIVLFTTRVILDALGAVDYGIYNLVAGIVSMLSFLQASLTQTTQRYIAYYIGRNDAKMQCKTFFNSLLLQLVLSSLLVLLLLFFEPIIFNHLVEIPIERLYVAKILYKLVLCSLFATMISAPYMATLIANENILYYSIVNILDSILLIPIALLIKNCSGDKLQFYGILITSIKVLNYLLYLFYCLLKYRTTISHSPRMFDKGSVKEIISFSVWTTYGASVPLIRNQGMAIVLNRFINTIANAAYGLSLQIYGQLGIVTASIVNAVGPQIIKAEGANNRNKMIRLSEISSKFCFYLVGIVVIPLFFEIDPLMSIWLKDIPENTCLFCRILLITLWVDQMSIGLATACQAVGAIKQYTLVVSTIKLMSLPMSFLLYKHGVSPVFAMMPFIICELISSVSRIFVAKNNFGLNTSSFVRKVLLKEFIPSFITCVIIYLFVNNISFSYRFLVTIIVSVFCMTLLVWIFGLENDEKNLLCNFANKTIRRI